MPVVLFASASSPKKLLSVVVSQPSRQTARAGGENASNTLAKAMRRKPYRESDPLIEFLVSKLLISIKQPVHSPIRFTRFSREHHTAARNCCFSCQVRQVARRFDSSGNLPGSHWKLGFVQSRSHRSKSAVAFACY